MCDWDEDDTIFSNATKINHCPLKMPLPSKSLCMHVLSEALLQS